MPGLGIGVGVGGGLLPALLFGGKSLDVASWVMMATHVGE
jgi:hypothetical protein